MAEFPVEQISGALTCGVAVGAAVFPAQPLKQRSHHLGTAEALESGPDVLMVPLQRTDLQNPGGKTSIRNTKPAFLEVSGGEMEP